MEEPLPRVKRKITPTSLYSIPSELEENVCSKHTGGLLADVTSLILLSAAAADRFSQEKGKCTLPSAVGNDQSSQLLQAVDAAINLFPQILRDEGSTSLLKESEKTMTENQDDSETVQGSENKTSAMASYFPRMGSVTSEVHRPFDDPLVIAHSTNPSPNSYDDAVSLQSSADSNLTDRPLSMTFDSGIASPASVGITGKSEKYRPLLAEDVNITSDLQHRLQHLRMCLEQKLQESMAGIAPCTLESKDFKPTSHPSVPAVNLTAQDPYVDRALTSSLLVYENTKLSAEVAYLQKKVEVLEHITGTQGFTLDTLKPTMETISIGSQTDLRFNQSMSTLDETDFGISDISMPSPNETNCLMGTILENQDICSPSGMSTPGGVPTKQTRRRKIEVPSHLKAASTSYLSINPWAEMDDKQQSGSSVGCWRGLCACFDRSTPARVN